MPMLGVTGAAVRSCVRVRHVPSTRYLSDEPAHGKRRADNESLITIASGDTVQVEIADVHPLGWGWTGVSPGNRTEAFA